MNKKHLNLSNINFLNGNYCDTCVWHYFIEDTQYIDKYCRFKSPRKMNGPEIDIDTYQQCPIDGTCQFWESESDFLKKYNSEKDFKYRYRFAEQINSHTIRKILKK